jgi:phosphatidylinositol glycan class W|eukprot:COSAG02_NODE_3084_length_7397_cov_3.401617_7_plen_249_part_00
MGYKEEKEAFVSNLNGTSMTEIALVSCLLPAGLFLRAALWRAIGSAALRKLPAAAVWLVEFVTVALPPLLSLIAPGQVPVMVLGTVAIASGLSVVVGECGTAGQARRRQDELRAAALSAPRKYHVAVFRATMMLTTCVCILAVDFHVFPRRFAKVETYGTGVMDIGVGAFVLANGLVSPMATSRKRLFGAIRSAGPLLVLGAGRLVSIKASGYPEHVTEYGVHWNFFLTLAVVSLRLHLHLAQQCSRL